MLLILQDNQKGTVSIAAVDFIGNQTPPFSGTPSWGTPTAPVTVTPAPDGLSAMVEANGPIGNGQIPVTWGGNTGYLDVQVTAGPAVGFIFVLGPVVSK